MGQIYLKWFVQRESKKKFLLKFSLLSKRLSRHALTANGLVSWNNVDHMNHPFMFDFPISLKSIFCLPLIVEEQVMGIVCGGSETKNATFSNLFQYGNILISMMTSNLQTDSMKESLDRHIMKMSTLLDMNKILDMATNIEDLLRELVDFTQLLIPSDFCIVTLINGKSMYQIKTEKIQS